MKRNIILIVLLILNHNVFCQVKYEPGYFINNNNETVTCFIRNLEWKNNPAGFSYKISENATPQNTSIDTVKEFGVTGFSRYRRFTVEIDKSSEGNGAMSTQMAPEFESMKVFLKTLVSGKTSLYIYENGNLRRFFFSTDSLTAVQLIFKNYMISESSFAVNNGFRQQLSSLPPCAGTEKSIANLSFNRKSLVNFFIAYNKCNDSSVVAFAPHNPSDHFHLSIRPGVNNSSVSTRVIGAPATHTDFGNKISFRAGLELEFVLPFRKGGWAIVLEPTYRTYEAENVQPGKARTVRYKSLEVPVGLRHYFFLSESSKIFANALLCFDKPFNSEVLDAYQTHLDVSSTINALFGAGYKFKKYSLELRYSTNRDILPDYRDYESAYRSISVILGFSFL